MGKKNFCTQTSWRWRSFLSSESTVTLKNNPKPLDFLPPTDNLKENEKKQEAANSLDSSQT